MSYEILKYEEYKSKGGKGNYSKGVLTTTLSNWSEFYNEISLFRKYRDYVWRGQRCGGDKWTLKSKFDRLNNSGDRNMLLKKHINQFRESIRGRRGTNPHELKEDELWSLGQHHGLNTPLLDWTKSPFVAAYFAFVKRGDNEQKKRKRVIYGLNKDIQRWYKPQKTQKDYFIEFPEIEAHENPRFLAQAGVFTKALNGQDIKDRVQRCYHKNNHRDRIILAEIFIPDSERRECLINLNEMNINHASLFPDIYGSSIFCNLKLEIDQE